MPTVRDLATLIESAPDLPWVLRAACGDLPLEDVDRFFVETGQVLTAETARLCAGCPVHTECLSHALALDLRGGYFAGLSPNARLTLTRAGR